MKLYQCAMVFLALVSTALKAEIAVVVNPSSSMSSISQDNVQRIFLGKTTRFEDGSVSKPINQNDGNPIRADFISKVLDKTEGQYRAYWSQLVFTGKGAPPKDSGGDAEIKAMVAKEPGTIGYINAEAVDETVKVVFTLK